MHSVMEWVRQTAVFYILSNLLVSVLPDIRYKKYLKTFTGILLIILTLNPVLSFFGNGSGFDSILGMEMSALKRSDEIMWMKMNGPDSFSSIMETYKNEIKKDIDKKAWEYALYVGNCDIVIEEDSEKEDFGMVKKVSVTLSKCKKEDISVEIGKIDIGGGSSAGDVSDPGCDKIREYIGSRYGVSPEDISVTLVN